jgi:hypothetical protein
VFGSTISLPPWACAAGIHRIAFERCYGLLTEGRVSARELGLPRPDFSDYMPFGLLSLRRALPRREVSTNDVFLDVGSGMSRIVLLAAMSYPFQRVLGVEIVRTTSDLHVRGGRGSLLPGVPRSNR